MKDCSSIPVQLLAATPGGDVPLNAEAAAQLLPSGPGESSAGEALSYGPYLEAVRSLMLRNSCGRMVSALSLRLGRPVRLAEIEGIKIRTEKHGPCYHVTRVEVSLPGKSVSFMVNTAAREGDNSALIREYTLLKRLGGHFQPSFLPQVYWRGAALCGQPGGKTRRLQMLVGEWFDDYHEFHLRHRDSDGAVRVFLWDSTRGCRYLSDFQSAELYRQAARILTLYYNWRSFRQVYPWHHAAGDFVVREADGRLDVRLITVRDYRSVAGYRTGKRAGRLLALIMFFLHLTVQMRLDRCDGVGELAWAPDWCLEGTVRGFAGGLAVGEGEGAGGMPAAPELLDLLVRFSEGEWAEVLEEMLHSYAFSREEAALIQRHASRHIEALCRVLVRYRSLAF